MEEIRGVTFRLNHQILYREEAQDQCEELFDELSFVLDKKNARVTILVLSKIIVSIVNEFNESEEMLDTIFESMRLELKSYEK